MIPFDVIVPVSGGKDSQACLKLAVGKYGASLVRGLFCDTQYEHPLTYAHIDKIRQMYGVEIERICVGSVEGEMRRYGRMPTMLSRFCTTALKIRPTRRYLAWTGHTWGQPFEVWYGMRTAESDARATRYAGKIDDDTYAPHEIMPSQYPQYLGRMGIRFRLPVINWSAADVKEFVGIENLNPLYDHFDRVGCFPCEAGGEVWREKAYNHDDFGRQQYRRIIQIAADIGKPVFRTKGAQARNPSSGCAVCSI